MKKVEITCSICSRVFSRLKKQITHSISIGAKAFICSRECQRAYQLTGKWVSCIVCNKSVYKTRFELTKHKTGNYFCSKSCANGQHNTLRSGSNHPNYINGIGGYRELAFQTYGRVCTVFGCGYAIEQILEVHHRNKNRSDNSKENLDVLCPTHHSEFDWEIRHYTQFGSSVIDNTSGSEPEKSRFDS